LIENFLQFVQPRELEGKAVLARLSVITWSAQWSIASLICATLQRRNSAIARTLRRAMR
jgi:hypothetical protein